MSDFLPTATLRVDLADALRASGAVAAMVSARTSPIMVAAISLALQKLTTVAAKERFTGEGPFPVSLRKLGNVSGAMKRMLHATPAKTNAAGITGSIGSSVEYFRAHELGFDGTVQVPAHTRGRYTVAKRGYSVLEQSVRAHSKRLKIPRRAPLSAAIEEHSARIFGKAIQDAMGKILATPHPA